MPSYSDRRLLVGYLALDFILLFMSKSGLLLFFAGRSGYLVKYCKCPELHSNKSAIDSRLGMVSWCRAVVWS